MSSYNISLYIDFFNPSTRQFRICYIDYQIRNRVRGYPEAVEIEELRRESEALQGIIPTSLPFHDVPLGNKGAARCGDGILAYVWTARSVQSMGNQSSSPLRHDFHRQDSTLLVICDLHMFMQEHAWLRHAHPTAPNSSTKPAIAIAWKYPVEKQGRD